MSSLGRWAIRISAAIVIAAASSCATLLWLGMNSSDVRQPSALTAGLGGSWEAISRELDRRVKNRFPLASREDAMTTELRREGFIRWDWTSYPGKEHEARRDESRFPCNESARIYWHADTEGNLTDIRGNFPMGACL